jgi:hypothetical protein
MAKKIKTFGRFAGDTLAILMMGAMGWAVWVVTTEPIPICLVSF